MLVFLWVLGASPEQVIVVCGLECLAQIHDPGLGIGISRGLTQPVGSNGVRMNWVSWVLLPGLFARLWGKRPRTSVGYDFSCYILIKLFKCQRRAPQHLFNRMWKPASSRVAVREAHRAELLASALENLPLPRGLWTKLSFWREWR